MFYAFIYQEYFLYVPSIYDNFGLSFGAGLGQLDFITADFISGTNPYDKDITFQQNIYPGELECRTYSPHALFHELAAGSFPDLFHISDSVNKVVLLNDKVKAYEKHYYNYEINK